MTKPSKENSFAKIFQDLAKKTDLSDLRELSGRPSGKSHTPITWKVCLKSSEEVLETLTIPLEMTRPGYCISSMNDELSELFDQPVSKKYLILDRRIGIPCVLIVAPIGLKFSLKKDKFYKPNPDLILEVE